MLTATERTAMHAGFADQMAAADAIAFTEEQLNARYGAFWVSAWSKTAGRYRNVGKPYPTIRAALDAAKRLEGGRYFGQMLFIDTAVGR